MLGALSSDSLTFVAKNDETLFSQLTSVDVLTVKEGAIDGQVRVFLEQRFQVTIMHLDTGNGPHRGLHYLVVIDIYRSFAGKYIPDSEPVSQTDDGSQIARVLDVVKDNIQTRCHKVLIDSVHRFLIYGNDVAGRVKL